MTLYMPAIIWFIGAGIGYFVLLKRDIKVTFIKNLLIAILGPLSIPVAFLYKPVAKASSKAA